MECQLLLVRAAIKTGLACVCCSYINSNTCMNVNPQKPGHQDEFYNNT